MVTVSDSTKFRNNIRIRLNKLIKRKKITENLEKGIYNYAIKVAKDKRQLGNGKINTLQFSTLTNLRVFIII